MAIEELAIRAIRDDLAVLAELGILLASERSETPLVRDDDLLATGELELGTTEGLDNVALVGVLGAHRHEDLLDVHASAQADGFTERTTHTGLQAIRASAGKHLVDANNVPRVHTNPHVERILACVLDQVLVGANASGLKGLAGKLLLLEGDHVNAERELVDGGLLATKIENSDLRVGHTTAVARLDVGLVFTEAVAASRA